MTSKSGLIAACAAAMVLPAVSASAAVLANYTFGAVGSATLAATATGTNATATNLAFGSQTTAVSQNGNNYSAPVWYAVAQSTTGAPTDESNYYAQITVTANAGYVLNLSSFSFDGSQGGGTAGTRFYAIHDSVDGLALSNVADINSGTSLNNGSFSTVRGGSTAAAVMPTYSADLSAAKFQGISSITMRVYFATGTNSQNIDVDNFVLNGAAVQATPEPASLGMLAVAGGLMARRRRA